MSQLCSSDVRVPSGGSSGRSVLLIGFVCPRRTSDLGVFVVERFAVLGAGLEVALPRFELFLLTTLVFFALAMARTSPSIIWLPFVVKSLIARSRLLLWIEQQIEQVRDSDTEHSQAASGVGSCTLVQRGGGSLREWRRISLATSPRSVY